MQKFQQQQQLVSPYKTKRRHHRKQQKYSAMVNELHDILGLPGISGSPKVQAQNTNNTNRSSRSPQESGTPPAPQSSGHEGTIEDYLWLIESPLTDESGLPRSPLGSPPPESDASEDEIENHRLSSSSSRKGIWLCDNSHQYQDLALCPEEKVLETPPEGSPMVLDNQILEEEEAEVETGTEYIHMMTIIFTYLLFIYSHIFIHSHIPKIFIHAHDSYIYIIHTLQEVARWCGIIRSWKKKQRKPRQVRSHIHFQFKQYNNIHIIHIHMGIKIFIHESHLFYSQLFKKKFTSTNIAYFGETTRQTELLQILEQIRSTCNPKVFYHTLDTFYEISTSLETEGLSSRFRVISTSEAFYREKLESVIGTAKLFKTMGYSETPECLALPTLQSPKFLHWMSELFQNAMNS